MNESSLAASYPVQFSANALLPLKNRDSLVIWFELYIRIKVDSPEMQSTDRKRSDCRQVANCYNNVATR